MYRSYEGSFLKSRYGLESAIDVGLISRIPYIPGTVSSIPIIVFGYISLKNEGSPMFKGSIMILTNPSIVFMTVSG